MPEETRDELEVVGDELYTPAVASKLEGAATALEGLTAQLGELMTRLEKGEEEKPAEPEADKESKGPGPAEEAKPDNGEEETEAEKGKEVAVVRELAERAMSLADKLKAEPMPPEKLKAELMGLMDLLKGLYEKYPEPESAKEPAKKADETQSALAQLSESFLGLSTKLCGGAELDSDFIGQIGGACTQLEELATSLEIAKSETEPRLPEVFSASEPETQVLSDAMATLLRSAAERVSAVTKMDVSDAVKAEIGAVRDILITAQKALPVTTAKSARNFSRTLTEVAERALTLSRKADKAGMDDRRAKRELANIQGLLAGMSEKYAGVKKAEEFNLGDLGQILDADRFLSQFEMQLAKLNIGPAPEPEVVPAPKPEVVATEAAPDGVDALMGQISTLADQVQTMQAAIAKARGGVTAPASRGGSAGPTENADLLFPSNYNDPAYRDNLKKRGIED